MMFASPGDLGELRGAPAAGATTVTTFPLEGDAL
jgi:hypothetical protein